MVTGHVVLFVLSLNLVMIILTVVVNKCALHVISYPPPPQRSRVSTTSVLGERLPWFVALVYALR